MFLATFRISFNRGTPSVTFLAEIPCKVKDKNSGFEGEGKEERIEENLEIKALAAVWATVKSRQRKAK